MMNDIMNVYTIVFLFFYVPSIIYYYFIFVNIFEYHD